MIAIKTCSGCGVEKPWREFARTFAALRPCRQHCTKCKSASNKRRRAAIKRGEPAIIRKWAPGATASPSRTDLAWAAGFMEGEGSFSSANGTRSCSTSAAQVQREPLERLVAWFGGTIALRPRQPNQQQAHIWTACGGRARGVMMTLYAFMSPRRKGQIRKALAPFAPKERAA